MDGACGLIDLPFYHIQVIMGYWPLDPNIAIIWAVYDNNINWTTNLHMLYLSYVRLRSFQSPKKFVNEILIRKPLLMMFGFWISGYAIMTGIVLICGVVEFTGSIDYQPVYIKSFVDLIMWFTPLTCITVISVILWRLLRMRELKKKHASKKKSIFHLSSHSRFQLMMFFYWFQWFIPCIVDMLAPCNCVSATASYTIYWLTYSVSLYM